MKKTIDLSKLKYAFKVKPLLVGGRAKEYYGIRQSGPDIDLVIAGEDYIGLSKQYPNNKKDLSGDLGVLVEEFEIWKTICWYDYNFLAEGALDMGEYKIISLEKLLFMTALVINNFKYENDLKLIVKKIFELKPKP